MKFIINIFPLSGLKVQLFYCFQNALNISIRSCIPTNNNEHIFKKNVFDT